MLSHELPQVIAWTCCDSGGPSVALLAPLSFIPPFFSCHVSPPCLLPPSPPPRLLPTVCPPGDCNAVYSKGQTCVIQLDGSCSSAFPSCTFMRSVVCKAFSGQLSSFLVPKPAAMISCGYGFSVCSIMMICSQLQVLIGYRWVTTSAARLKHVHKRQ